MTRIFLLIACLALTGLAQETDEAGLKARIRGRAESVRLLLNTGAALETKGGLLRSEAAATAADKPVIKAENADRQAVWELVAQRTRTTPEKVKELFAARSIRRPTASIQTGACTLTPTKPVDVSRLLKYLKQGMNYASQKKFDLALSEFQPALDIDRNFLALNQNVGAAQMGLKKFAEAEAAFRAEVKLLDCLVGLNDNSLADFGYFYEVPETDPARRRQLQAAKLKAELPKAKAVTHYNLACNYSLQKQKDGALSELKLAIDAGFSGKLPLNTDPDLAFVRQSPEFRELLGKVK